VNPVSCGWVAGFPQIARTARDGSLHRLAQGLVAAPFKAVASTAVDASTVCKPPTDGDEGGTMRRAVVLTVVSLLTACGGGSSNNNNNNNTPTLRNFSYGAPAAPTTAQQGTATTAQTQLKGVVTATNGGQVVNASSAPTLTDTLAASLPASLIAAPNPAEAQANPAGPVAALRRSSALSGNCISVSGSTITYNSCSLSETGYTITLNGSLSSTSSSVTWNLTETYTYSLSGYNLNGNATWAGNIAATSSTITGQGRSTYHYTGNYQNINIAYDYVAAIDINLTYQTSPSFCINGGTLEIRRVVATTSGNATPVHDAALKFTWTGCGTYTVEKGT
jgi:hypothetical protein